MSRLGSIGGFNILSYCLIIKFGDLTPLLIIRRYLSVLCIRDNTGTEIFTL